MKNRIILTLLLLCLILGGCSSANISHVKAEELADATTEDVSALLDSYTIRTEIQETLKTVTLSEILTQDQISSIIARISEESMKSIADNGLVTADDIATLKQSIESEILASIEEKSTQAEVEKIADAVVAQASAEVGQQNAVLLDELDAKLCEAINSIGTVSPISTGGQDTLISEIKNSVITQINNEGITAATSPVKGKDYFTQAEVNSMVTSISNQLISDGTLKVTVTNEITDSEVKDITDAVMVVVLNDMNTIYATRETEVQLKNSLATMISKADSLQAEIVSLQDKMNTYGTTQETTLIGLQDNITDLLEKYNTLKSNVTSLSKAISLTTVSMNVLSEALGNMSGYGSATTLVSTLEEVGDSIGPLDEMVCVDSLKSIPSDLTYNTGNSLVDSINNLYLLMAEAEGSMNGNRLTYEGGLFYITNEDGTKKQVNSTQEAYDALQEEMSDGKTAIATAISSKGIPTSATDDFTTMASNLDKIQAEAELIGTFSSGSVNISSYRSDYATLTTNNFFIKIKSVFMAANVNNITHTGTRRTSGGTMSYNPTTGVLSCPNSFGCNTTYGELSGACTVTYDLYIVK